MMNRTLHWIVTVAVLALVVWQAPSLYRYAMTVSRIGSTVVETTAAIGNREAMIERAIQKSVGE